MKFKTKVLPLKWTYISGTGSPKYGKQFTSEDPFDFEYKASTIVDAKQAKEIQKQINEFWRENKPAKIVKPTTTFLKPEMVESDSVDEYGAKIKKPSGNYVLSASTNSVFKTKEGIVKSNIAILNSKGQKFPEIHPLVKGEVGVGDGSLGVIHGDMAITEFEGKAYVKLYLKGVQFAKFIPYEGGGIDAEDLGVEDDGTNLESDGCDVENISDTEKPAL